MDIHCPVLWTTVADGSDATAPASPDTLPPKPGQRALVAYQNPNPAAVGDRIILLWKPPLSAINGWPGQPSDIGRSYLVSARVNSVAQAEPGEQLPFPEGCLRHGLDIVVCEPLLPALKRLPLENRSWALPEVLDTTATPPTNRLTLAEMSWCGTATVGGLTYMAASTSGEAQIELLVYDSDAGMVGLFCSHADPGGAFTALGKQMLTSGEADCVRRAMRGSQPLANSAHAGATIPA